MVTFAEALGFSKQSYNQQTLQANESLETMNSLIWQIFIENLLCARYIYEHIGYTSKQNRQRFLSLWEFTFYQSRTENKQLT